MNITQMIAELHSEREHVAQAILVLERVAAGRGRRRGRHVGQRIKVFGLEVWP